MNDPCGDITCHCCYPDLTCWCSDRPAKAQHGSVYECPECGASSRAVAYDQAPDYVRARMDRTWAIISEAAARNPHMAPTRPTLTWQQVTPPNRIPGSAK